MVKLLCLGGPSHGKRVEVNLKQGYVEVMEWPPMRAALSSPTAEPNDEYITVPHTTYYVQTIYHDPDPPTRFLSPQGWSVAKVMKGLLKDSERLAHLVKQHKEDGVHLTGI